MFFNGDSWFPSGERELLTLPNIIGGGVILTIIVWVRFFKRGPVCNSKKDLTGKTVLVTGGNRGIGKGIAIGLAKCNARVIICCRNNDRGCEAVKEIRHETGNDQVHSMKLDLADFESIREFAEEFLKSESNLHILVNNAGIILEGKTKDGLDLMFGTNYLGPFLLTQLLMPILRKTAKKSPIRIVNVASEGYKFGKIDFDNLNPDINRNSTGLQIFKQYASTKLMNVYFTKELDKRLRQEGGTCNNITVYAVHPGAIQTHIGADQVNKGRFFSWLFRKMFFVLFCRSSFYGCQTPLYCCLEDGLEESSGNYFTEMRQRKLYPVATDEKVSSVLWQKSREMCHLE